MIKKGAKGVKFTVVNTDVQDLNQSKATKKIHIGKTLTGGIGTGMNPEIGKQAALETKEELITMLKDSNIVFITGGMGGGTGTGATPVISAIAKELGILTVAVVTKPFFFEGNRRITLAEQGIATLAQHVDAYIVIPNDKILEAADGEATMNEAFALSDDVLLQAVTGVSNLITTPGRINIDSSDIRTVLKDSGMALVGIGSARGEKRAEQAALKAINSPLLDISMSGAQAVLFSISAGDDLKMAEVATIASMITKEIEDDAIVKFGTIRDLKLKKGEIKVTVVASGFDKHDSAPVVQESAESTYNQQQSDDIFDTKHEDISLGEQSEPLHIIDESVGGSFKSKKDIEISEDEDTNVWSSVPGFLKKKK
jgi:cell division protein FtsZ